MRFYFMGDGEELYADLVKTEQKSPEMISFDWEGGGERKRVFVRQLAGNYFSSFDGISWEKVPLQSQLKSFTHINRDYNVYRGYLPSGIGAGDEGALLTKMPGKVISILVKEGQKVEKGETLLILEAMKMENEIKANQNGKITGIHVQEGQALEDGVLMMDIEGEA